MSMSLALALAVTIGSVVGVLVDPLWLSSLRWLLAVCGALAFVSAARQLAQLAWPLTMA
jgi:hypothetical protein